MKQVALPNASGPGAPVEFLRLFAVTTGVLPVLTLTSALDELESTAAGDFQRFRTRILLLGFVASSACITLGALVGGDVSALQRLARALPAWFGLALLSGRLLGWRLSWVLPWGVVSALIYWGFDGAARDYRWWEFTAQPIWHRPSLALSCGLLAVGLGAYASTPWRVSALRRMAGSRLRLTPRLSSPSRRRARS